MARVNSYSRASRPIRTIAIVGAGFSGTAIATRLLREPPFGRTRIVLIERSARFGPGVAYAGQCPAALLNVPAGRMSLNEREPDDFVDYLLQHGVPTNRDDFVPRQWFGRYLEARLSEAQAAAASDRIQLVRARAIASGIFRSTDDGGWRIEFSDGQVLTAQAVVLAFGHYPPRCIDALRPLIGSRSYTADPWAPGATLPVAQDVLVVGTGLTMADIVLDLMQRPNPPNQVVAVSRHGLLPHTRRSGPNCEPTLDVDLRTLGRPTSVRSLVARTRGLVTRAAREGTDWRDVVAAIRVRVPEIWHRLGHRGRSRFLRHLQPYWDIHRHQLPPAVGAALQSLIDAGKLRIRAARIVGVRVEHGQVIVDLRPRGESGTERFEFGHVINCTGPDYQPQRVDCPLVRSLLADGLITPDPSGMGLAVDEAGRLTDRNQRVVPNLYYLGPWLRGRYLEATAVPELRVHATQLAEHMRRDLQSAPESTAVSASGAHRIAQEHVAKSAESA